MALPRFQWTTFDVSDLLPPRWQQDALAVATKADFRQFPRTPLLSREGADVQQIARGRVHADQVRDGLPWLYRLYRSGFLELVQRATHDLVSAAQDERYRVVLNVQRGMAMRFECHVDSNPLTALLFCSDHYAGAGGELVFARDADAASAADIDRSCSVLRPQSGHLVIFDGRHHPHYARPLTAPSAVRVVAVMNYYTSSFPESARPPELNRHLYGDN